MDGPRKGKLTAAETSQMRREWRDATNPPSKGINFFN